MHQKRWKAVNEIFHAALEVPPGERADFLYRASEGDSGLRLEVERMLQADAKADGYLESLTELDDAIGSFNLIQSGDILKNRFHIRRLLGEGGMGQVFEAWDEELKIRVALKVIRPEIADNPAMRASFRREVRIARAITHPNVCRIYDLERAVLRPEGRAEEEILFLTMEFLEGETLAARIGETGPLPLSEALTYARQTALALEAAHAEGVVHRDIKPANIMLVGAGRSDPHRTRVVITDFGLARTEAPGSELRGSSASIGVPAGTVAYMAPEQMEPHGEVTAATDVYAFGLVLFEMVTGKRAFPSANLLTGIAQRLSGPPPSPRSLNPDLPEIWETVIQRCLRREALERFASASEALHELEAGSSSPARGQTAIASNSAAASSLRHALPRRRPLTIAGVALMVLAGLSFFWGRLRLYLQPGDPKVAPGALVYLAPLQNRTSERELDNLTELLSASLSQSAQIRLLDQGRVGDTLQLMTKPADTVITAPIAREIAMRTGAVRVIFVTLSGTAGSYEMDADIQQTDNTPSRARNEWKNSFAWKDSIDDRSGTMSPELLRAVRDTADWIRAKTGESANDIARLDAPPEDVTTGNWEALQDYSEALAFNIKRQPEKAVVALESAVSRDSQFALAYARLGDILYSLSRTQEGYSAYRRALDPQLANRLTRRERDRIRGMYALDTMDYATAEAAFRDYSSFYEDDYTGWAYQSYPLKMLGRTDEAISALRHAMRIAPQFSFGPSETARYLLIQGKYEEAEQWIEVLRKGNHIDSALEVEGPLYALQFKFDRAAAAFQGLIASAEPGSRSDGYSLLAHLYAEMGDLAKAQTAIDAGISEDRSQGNTAALARKLADKGYIECGLERFQECLDDTEAARQMKPIPYVVFTALESMARIRASGAASLRPRVERELNSLSQSVEDDDTSVAASLMRLRIHAEQLMLHGKSALALAELRQADKLDAPAGQRGYLGRGLLAAIKPETSPDAARTLRTEALRAFEVLALKPGFLWQEALVLPPGFLADQMASVLKTASALDMSNADTAFCRDWLDRSRNDANARTFPIKPS